MKRRGNYGEGYSYFQPKQKRAARADQRNATLAPTYGGVPPPKRRGFQLTGLNQNYPNPRRGSAFSRYKSNASAYRSLSGAPVISGIMPTGANFTGQYAALDTLPEANDVQVTDSTEQEKDKISDALIAELKTLQARMGTDQAKNLTALNELKQELKDAADRSTSDKKDLLRDISEDLQKLADEVVKGTASTAKIDTTLTALIAQVQKSNTDTQASLGELKEGQDDDRKQRAADLDTDRKQRAADLALDRKQRATDLAKLIGDMSTLTFSQMNDLNARMAKFANELVALTRKVEKKVSPKKRKPPSPQKQARDNVVQELKQLRVEVQDILKTLQQGQKSKEELKNQVQTLTAKVDDLQVLTENAQETLEQSIDASDLQRSNELDGLRQDMSNMSFMQPPSSSATTSPFAIPKYARLAKTKRLVSQNSPILIFPRRARRASAPSQQQTDATLVLPQGQQDTDTTRVQPAKEKQVPQEIQDRIAYLQAVIDQKFLTNTTIVRERKNNLKRLLSERKNNFAKSGRSKQQRAKAIAVLEVRAELGGPIDTQIDRSISAARLNQSKPKAWALPQRQQRP